MHTDGPANTPVQLDETGLPCGFLQSVADNRTIAFDVADGIGIVKLNRPAKLNAFDERMIRELRAVIWRANFDDSIRVLIITGVGRAFCAGRDINGLDYENNLTTPQYR